MARTRVVEAPPHNDRYVGMLALAAIAMFIGVVLLALDANTYDWESPKASPPISLPKSEPRGNPDAPKAGPTEGPGS